MVNSISEPSREEFLQALKDIEESGNKLKIGIQVALRKSTLEILNRKQTDCLDMLWNKLENLESDYYKTEIKKRINAFIGYVEIEHGQDGVTRYWFKNPVENPLVYCNKKGKKGWSIKWKNLDSLKKTYEIYFKNQVHFMSIKIKQHEEKEEKKEIYQNKIKDIIDRIWIIRGLPDDSEWDNVSEKYKDIYIQLLAIVQKNHN